MNESEDAVIDYLKKVRAMRASHPRPAGWHYFGMEDFLLQHGKFYKPVEWDRFQGRPQVCFGNALICSSTFRLGYVEGVALSRVAFVVHHGWNTNGTGEAIDVTWSNDRVGGLGFAYFGVEFAPGRAARAQLDHDGTVFDCWKSDFAIYKKPWTGEQFKRWKTPKLDELWARAHS